MSGDYKENQEAIIKLSVQAGEYKTHPFHAVVAKEMKKKIDELERRLRRKPRKAEGQINFEKYGREQLVTNTELDVWGHWDKIIEDAIKNGQTARGRIKE